MESAISCRNLSKRYGDVLALDHLTLDVPTGSLFGFLGPNGAGKTTALRLLTGLAFPTIGDAAVLGMDVSTGGLNLRRRIGVLSQSPQYYSWMQGRELLAFAGRLFGLQGRSLRSRVDEALALTDLTGGADRRIGGYSGGMRQRLGLAQALINRPEILFLDEPVSALDPAGRHEILEVISNLRGQVTVFMSSHILADIERICDSVAIIDQGRLLVASSMVELQQRYAQPIFVIEPEPGQKSRMKALIEALSSTAGVTSIAENSGEIRVLVQDGALAGQSILSVLVSQGIAIRRFERSRPSLEDIFLRIVGADQAPKASVV
jgi:ABC-2 type transport system ATP-binding protein